MKVEAVGLQPCQKVFPRLTRQADKAKTRVRMQIFPGEFCLAFNNMVSPGKSESKPCRAALFELARKLQCHAGVADVQRYCALFDPSLGRHKTDRKLNFYPSIAAALAFHEITGSAEAALGLFEGDGLIQDKVRLPGEPFLSRAESINQRCQDCVLVIRRQTNAGQHAGGIVLLRAVQNDRSKSASGQLLNGGAGVT